MKAILISVTIAGILTTSCSKSNSEKYWIEEDNAIVDLIPEMVDAESMLRLNDYGSDRPTLILVDDLFNDLKISKYDNVSDMDREKLRPLTSKRIENRRIAVGVTTQVTKLKIQLITSEEFEKNHSGHLVEKVNRDKLFGYLWISRIVFVDDFQTGYVAFDFFCGEACAWNSVLEIKKLNGHWIKSRFIFGGIA